VTYLRAKPWRSRAPFASHLAASRRRGSCGPSGWPLREAPDGAGELDEEPSLSPGTTLAIEQADVVRTTQGRIDESGLLAFHRRTTIAEHANHDGRLPVSIAAGRHLA
jgi:hypothetical protein